MRLSPYWSQSDTSGGGDEVVQAQEEKWWRSNT